MNKVLVGVGIGCGALILIAVVGAVGAGMWAKGKVEDLGAMAGADQQEEIQRLNQKYDFEKPPRGQPVVLTERRVRDYLAVREALTPVMKKFEARGQKFEDKSKDGQKPSFGDAMEAMSMLGGMMTELRVAWLEALDDKNMSPNEFGAITAAIYGAPLAHGLEQMKQSQRPVLEQLRAQAQKTAEDASLPQEARDMAQEQLNQIDEQLAALPETNAAPSDKQKLFAQNKELLDRMQVDMEKANPGVDILLGSLAAEGFVEQFEALGAE